MFDSYCASCKVSGSRNLENFCLWIRSPGKFCLWNPESRALESRIELKYPTTEWNLESKFHWRRLESSTRNPEPMEWDPESKTVLYSLTWGESTGLWTANYYFSFIYIPLTRSPHLKTFVNEISIRRVLPFTDWFFLLRVVSFCFHAPRDSPESKATFVLQLVNKKVGTCKY